MLRSKDCTTSNNENQRRSHVGSGSTTRYHLRDFGIWRKFLEGTPRHRDPHQILPERKKGLTTAIKPHCHHCIRRRNKLSDASLDSVCSTIALFARAITPKRRILIHPFGTRDNSLTSQFVSDSVELVIVTLLLPCTPSTR